ncbi:MAG TPA: hypothetical protein VGM94_05155 [Galbitalea sp.]|jgi:hypothetical protein
MSDFSDKVVELLDLIDGIDYGNIELQPGRNLVDFNVWYCAGDRKAEEAVARVLIDRLLDRDYTVARNADIGHTWITGRWNDLTVIIRTGPGAFNRRLAPSEVNDARFEWTDDLEQVKP